MSEKGIAEVIRSEVNIFFEDEKEKRFNESKQLEEQNDRGTKESINMVQINDQVRDVEKGEDVTKKGAKRKDGGKSQNSVGHQTLWIQYSGYGGGGGGGGGYDQTPLNYDPESRNYFVKFVFIILLVMLLLTVGFVAIVLNTPDIKDLFIDHHLMFLLISLGIMISLNYMMMCSECSRRPPCNFICLVIAVIGMSLVVSTLTCRMRTNIIFYAFIATAVVVFVCVLLACSRFDFTKWYLFIVVIATAFAAVASIISVTMLIMKVHYKPVQIAILLIGTVINVVVLILELQTILGGRAVELGESDYALAAFMLYTSIIDLFLKILQTMDLFDD